MPKKNPNKNKASIDKRKFSIDNSTDNKIDNKKRKIITDSEEEKEEGKEEGKEEENEGEKEIKKNEIKYPKDFSSDLSVSTDKTEENIKKGKGKRKKNKSVTKDINKKNVKGKQKRYSTSIKEIKKEKKKDDSKEKKKKGKNKNMKEDIEMRDDTHNNEILLNEKYFLPCRKKEQEIIYNYIKKGLETNGNYNSLYIAGMPGTGKTACVKKVIEALKEENAENEENKPFNDIFLSGTEFPFINNMYRRIHNEIFDLKKRKKKLKYIQRLDRFFRDRDSMSVVNLKDPSKSHILLIVDEIDYLINKNQNLLYNIFNWTTYEYSKLIVLSISNTLDLPEHLLPKVRSRMGNNKLMFKPYNKDELIEIIESKGIDYQKFSSDSIKLCCMKVSAINGDLRRTFQILLRAKELFNLECKRKTKYKKIEKNFIIQACDDLFNSKIKKVIESLQLCEKIVICAILSKIKDENNNRINLGDIYEKMDIFFEKYNEKSKKMKLELNWEEYKSIIYNLYRLELLNFGDRDKSNFIENSVTIKFYVDEFVIACDNDKELKPVLNYLTDLISS